MRLVVHAVQALDDGFLQLIDHVGALAGDGIDAMDALVMDLHLEVLGPAAIAAQPRSDRSRSRHGAPFYAPGCAPPERRLAGSRRGALGAAAGRRTPSGSTTTVEAFGKATAAKDYQRLCDDLLAPKLVEEVEAVGLPCEVALRQGLGEVEAPTITIGRINVRGDNATAEVRSAAAGEQPSADTLELVRVEDDSWRIASLQ